MAIALTDDQHKDNVTQIVSRRDIYDNNFLYSIIDLNQEERQSPDEINDIFSGCKTRTARQRTTSSMTTLEPL